MANILSAAAKAASERVSSSVKDAKEHVMNQFDPRGSIYQLGLGVGPLIRQTVAEYNKQQTKKDKKDTARSESTLVDIKKINQKSSASLTQLSARLDKMNSLLAEIKTINLAQLRSQRQSVFAERAGDAMSAYKMFHGAKTNASDVDNTPRAKEEGGGLMSTIGSMLTSPAGMTTMGVIAGGLIFQNREAIGKFIDNFLKSAGLPTKEELADEMKDSIKEGVSAVAGLVADGLISAVKGLIPWLAQELKDRVAEALGLKEKVDKNGKPTGEKLPANPKPLGEAAGIAGGMALGAKVPGFWGKMIGVPLGAALGYTAGDYAPEAAIAGTAIAGGLALKGKFGAAAKIAEAGAGGAASTIDDVAKAAGTIKPSSSVAATAIEKPGFMKSAEDLIRERAARMSADAGEAAAGTSMFSRVTAFVKEMTEKVTDKAASVLTTSKDAIAGVAEAAESSAAMTGAKAIGKKVVGSGIIGGALSGGIDYAQNKDATGALITGALNVLLGGGGALLGGMSPIPGGAVMGGFGGGLLADYLADRINGWRRGGNQGGVQGVNYNFGNTPRFQTVAYNQAPQPGVGQGTQEGTWDRIDPRTGQTADDRPYLNPIEGGRITGHIGENRGDHVHAGTDIAGAKPGMKGVAVRAIADGFIEERDYSDTAGNYVILRHSGDNNTSVYMHLAEIFVRRKQQVKKGDTLGIMGSTGRSSAEHLHLEIRKGGSKSSLIDPESVIAGMTGGRTDVANLRGSTVGGRDQNLGSMAYTEQQIADIGTRNATLNKFRDIADLLPRMLEAAASGGGGGGGGQNGGGGGGGGNNRATPSNNPGSNAKDKINRYVAPRYT